MIARDFLPDASPDHPGVITLPPAYQRREPCPLCRSGRLAVDTPPRQPEPDELAQGVIR